MMGRERKEQEYIDIVEGRSGILLSLFICYLLFYSV